MAIKGLENADINSGLSNEIEEAIKNLLTSQSFGFDLSSYDFHESLIKDITEGIKYAYTGNTNDVGINDTEEVKKEGVADTIVNAVEESEQKLGPSTMQSEGEMDDEENFQYDDSLTTSLLQQQKEQRSEENWETAKGVADNPYLKQGLTMGVDMIRDMKRDDDINANSTGVNDMRSNIDKALINSGNPYAMAAGVANEAMYAAGLDADASQGLGEGVDLANAAMSLLVPGSGLFAKDLSDRKVDVSDAVLGSSSYSGVVNNANSANQNAGKILFGAGMAEHNLDEANRQNSDAERIIKEGRDRYNAASNSSVPNEVYYKLNGNLNNGIQYGEDGIKVNSEPDSRLISSEASQRNVIPSGAKHANRHRLETKDNASYFVDNMTKKGIPVFHCDDVTGEALQDCEIEKEEIIFNKELTDFIEESRQIGTLEAALELGKRMVYEIFHNTDDNVGLLKNKKA